MTWRRPFQGLFVIYELELKTFNVSTNLEVSISTHYEDMKGETKCGNGVVGGS